MRGVFLDKISIVIPCYNEEAALPQFFAEAQRVAAGMTPVEFEYFFVDDGSADGTLGILRGLAAAHANVHYIALSRNFGKEAAMLAGLEAATGDYVAVMDADMQDPPSLLPAMYRAVKDEGYDCAATRRVTRAGEPALRSFFARQFYKLINKMSKTEIVDGARDFRLMTRQMTQAVLRVQEYNRFSKGIFSWVGFSTKWFEYENVARVAGETKWSFWKLFVYSIDGITAFSTVPLSAAAFAGVAFCAIALLALLFVFLRALIFGDPVSGWPSMVCIILLVSGVQLFCIGILGQYLAKTYMEVKRRPPYVVKEQK